MTVARGVERLWTATDFIAADQHAFGDAWRYELVDGRIVAHAAPTPEHGAILAGLTGALGRALASMPGGCRPETGSAASPTGEQSNTARIPDALVRCNEHPRVVFEIVSPSEIRDWRARDQQRQHLQSVAGVQEIVELYQDDFAAHVYRLSADGGWRFSALGGPEAVLGLESLGVDVSLSDIYVFATIHPLSREA